MPAIVHYGEDGTVEFMTTGEELFVIDERCPNDRVYRISRRIENTEALKLLADSPVGHAQDDRHPAVAARIEEALTGKPRLSVVRPEADL